MGDCAERDLVSDIADVVYDKNVARGLHRSDSKERRFSFIDLSFDFDPQDMAVFSDHLWRANPFVDDFCGLDAISLLSWPTANGDAWRALGRHVRENARTADFVFVVKPGATMAESLMDALTGEWGVPAELIEVAPPTREMLLFGRLRNEFFYGRDWEGVSLEDFASQLDDYMRYYRGERIKRSLGWMSPVSTGNRWAWPPSVSSKWGAPPMPPKRTHFLSYKPHMQGLQSR